MRKNKKIVLIIVAILAITLSFVCGNTYAKYMSRVTGQGRADIAKWNFKVNEKEDEIQTISLKSTVNNETLSDNKIAPGTSGNFQIKLDASDSEVGIDYTIKIENETRKPTNLKFIYNEKIYNSMMELQEDLSGTINANDEDKIRIINIDWKWQYETGITEEEINKNNLIDTKESKEITDYSFNLIVLGTQVSPLN